MGWLSDLLGLATTDSMEDLMTAITDFRRSFDEHMTRHDEALARVSADLAGVKADLEAIQTSPGTLSPEDQASLDGALERLRVGTEALETLDSMTPPKPPTA